MSILMTVEELAKYLKIKPDTIYKKVRKGELPAIKLGKLVRFPKELIDEWIIDQATKTVKEVKAARKMVEAEVGKAVGRAQDVVESAVDSARDQAEQAVGEVRKTQEHLTKSIKGLFTDLRTTVGFPSPKKGTKKKKIAKTKAKKVVKAKPALKRQKAAASL